MHLHDVNKIPKPEENLNGNAKLYGANGATLNPTQEANIMVRADRKLSEPSRLSTGLTLAMPIATMAITLLGALLFYLFIFAGERSAQIERDKKIVEDIQRIANTQVQQDEKSEKKFDKIDSKLERIDDRLNDRREKEGELRGIKKGVLSGEK